MLNQSKVNERLVKEQKEILESIETVKKSDPFNDPSYLNDNAATDTDAREQEQHQRVEAEIEALTKRLKNIELAIIANNKGLYGVCNKCGTRIPEKRLDLVPEALYCVECEASLLK
jgi:DnaK suppressor protein